MNLTKKEQAQVEKVKEIFITRGTPAREDADKQIARLTREIKALNTVDRKENASRIEDAESKLRVFTAAVA